MQFNIVYTLFFATAIVCAVRGLGWWGAHFVRRKPQGRPHGRDQVDPGAAIELRQHGAGGR